MDEEFLLDKEPNLAQFDCITGSSACSHAMPVLTLACTINGKSPYPSEQSFVIKSYYSDADGESKDCGLFMSNLSAAFSTTRAHS